MSIADLHVPTDYSLDGTASIEAVLAHATRNAGLRLLAITHLDCIDGALHALTLAPANGIEVIAGIEISTRHGHLLALEIRHPIPRGLNAVETVRRVADLGGYCIAPHPFGRGRLSLGCSSLQRIMADPKARATILGIEAKNGGPLSQVFNQLSADLPGELGLAATRSRDSHILQTLGRMVTQFEGETASDHRRALELRWTRAVVRKAIPDRRILLMWMWAGRRRRWPRPAKPLPPLT